MLVPTYLSAIPKDPQASTTNSTGYRVGKNSSGKVVVTAPQTESGDTLVIGNPDPVIIYYTVIFDSEGGTPDFSTTTDIISGATTSLPSNPTKDGYDFGGWYTEPSGAGEQFTSGTGVIANITVYANWTVADACSHSASDPDCWSDYILEGNIMGGPVYWGPTGVVTNASSTTNGLANSNLLKNLAGTYPAADACAALTEDGYAAGTWYLPALEELRSAYNNNVTGFPVSAYWASTELTNNFARVVFFEDGHINAYIKTEPAFDVRCLR